MVADHQITPQYGVFHEEFTDTQLSEYSTALMAAGCPPRVHRNSPIKSTPNKI
jgi:hypothetical protein